MDNLTDREMARQFAHDLREWRIAPRGAAITQEQLASQSGVGLTPLKRFEKTGGITLNNLVALLRVLGLLDRLMSLVPKPSTLSPLELLKADRAMRVRRRAPRSKQSPIRAEPKQTRRG
jgi:hypothetical protein